MPSQATVDRVVEEMHTQKTKPMALADAPTQAPADPAQTADVPAAPIQSGALDRMAMDEYRAAHSENMKRDFVTGVMAARNVVEKPYTPPAVPERIAESTRLEMAAGAKRVAEFEQIEAQRPKRPVDPSNGTMTPVFRPADYVPDPKKNQGQTNARPVA